MSDANATIGDMLALLGLASDGGTGDDLCQLQSAPAAAGIACPATAHLLVTRRSR